MARVRPLSLRRRGLAALTALAVAGSGLFLLSVGPAQAAAVLDLAKSAPGSALAGDPITYRLTVTNDGDEPIYNLAFREILPPGIRYATDSTSPTSAGEPTTGPGLPPTDQVVLWNNVTDLQPGSTFTLTFRVTVDADLYPVGSTITNTASVFGSTDPRILPRFGAGGQAIPSPAIVSDTVTADPTRVTAITVRKSVADAPEGELLRGIHSNPTVYTLRVINNDAFATRSVVLTDHLPAGLEFLGCGGVDNSAPPQEEYPGAPSLDQTPVPDDCTDPDSVATVEDPGTIGGTVYPPGVYTRVQWTLGDLAPGEEVVRTYAAGIPLRANTLDFPGGAPTPESLGQVANLDNNATGDPTRETGSALALTNIARVVGDYDGPFAPGGLNPVADDDRTTVTAQDVRLLKSVDPERFDAGGIAEYTLRIDVSEYVDADAIVVTDTVPNGLCPLSSTTNFAAGSPGDCDPVSGQDPVGADYDSVTQNDDGTFTVVFTGLDVDADGNATITFPARMRTTYTGGSFAGLPTVAGDSFTNEADLRATTLGIPGTDQDQSVGVVDDSQATQTTDSLTIAKRIQPRQVPYTCDLGPYVGPGDPGFGAADTSFRKGERVCFELDVRFPTTASSRNVVVTDFVPDGTVYEPGSQTLVSGFGSGVSFNEAAAASGAENPTWTLGSTTGSGSALYVPSGERFTVRFSVRVERASNTEGIDITDNLMKMRSESSTGQAQSYRDAVPFGLIPAPPVPVVKGVASINATPVNLPPAPNTNVDGSAVREGDVVRFRIDYTNDGDAGSGNDFSIRGVDLWDLLPVGITCSAVSAISPVSSASGAPVGVCTNPGDSGHPTFSERATRSAIRWVSRTGLEGDADRVVTGETRTLTYDVTIPTPTSVSTVLTNDAYVRSFDAFTNLFDVTATYFPSSNVDTTVDPADYDGPPSFDPSNVVVPSATFTKTRVATGVVEQNNTAAQAVNGETVTYEIALDVPARTTVFNGTVTDGLPSSLSFVSASIAFRPNATNPATDDLPAGTSFNAANGTLTLGGVYTNASATPQRFLITLVARPTPTTTPGTKTNTARFTRTPTSANTGAITLSRTATVTVIQPQAGLAKANDAGPSVTAGQTVEYTLTATNTPGRPPLHDSVVVDCLPNGMGFVAFGTPSQGSVSGPTPGTGTNGCGIGTQRLQWNVGTVLGGTVASPDPGETLTYRAEVDPSAAGGQEYLNAATIVGSSLNDGANDVANEFVSGDDADSRVQVGVGSIAKTVTPERARVGETVRFTVALRVPADVNFYNATILDNVPAGLDTRTATLISTSCETFPARDACTIPPAVRLTPGPAQAPATGNVVGWTFGDILASPVVREATFVYDIEVQDVPSNVRGTPLTNIAGPAWDLTSGQPAPTTVEGALADLDVRGDSDAATVTVQEPDLSVTKTPRTTRPEPGTGVDDGVIYDLAITNRAGSNVSTAYNVVVTDTVPNGLIPVLPIPGATFAPDADPSDGGGTLTFVGTVPLTPGATFTASYRAILAPSGGLDGSALVNTLAVDTFCSLPSPCTNDPLDNSRVGPGPSTTASVTPAFPKLTTTKVASGGPVAYLDEEYAWTVEAENTGDGRAFAVAVTDALPPNWRYVAGSAVITTPTSSAPAAPDDAVIGLDDVQTLTWNDTADLAPGERVVVEFRATPNDRVPDNPGVGSDVEQRNTARATAEDATGASGSGAGDYGSDDATAVTRIDAADLLITKDHGPEDPVAGAPFEWRLTVANQGDDVAVGPFVVTDTLPDGPAFGPPGGDGWTCGLPDGDRTFTCSRTDADDTLAPGASFPAIEVVTTIDSDTAEGVEFTNEASVRARTFDPETAISNVAEDTVTTRTEADLSIVKSLVGDLVPGRQATYTLDVANNGPSTSRAAIDVVDPLPTGLTLVDADGGPAWDCSGSSRSEVVCVRTDDLSTGAAAPRITVTVEVDASVTGTVENTARVDGRTTTDPVDGNNASTVTEPVAAEADLGVVKTPKDDLVPGRTGTYVLSITNDGPSDAQADITVTDDLPAGLTFEGFLSIDGTWACDDATGPVVCTLDGALPAGGAAEVEIDVRIDAALTGPITNTAFVDSSTTPDPNPGNDSSTATTDPRPLADVLIVKSHDGVAVAGGTLDYTLEVGNGGDSDAAPDVVVTDTLPPGLTYRSHTSSGDVWDCVPGATTSIGQEVVCTLLTGVLAAGADAPDLTLTVDVAPEAGPGSLTNVAVVASGTEDPVPGNNRAEDPTTIVDEVNVSIEKETTGRSTIVAGETGGTGTTTFTLIVTNDGPSAADDVTVVDTLPTGLIPVSVSGSGWTCDDPVVAPTITCTRGSLGPGTSTITVTARADASVLDGSVLTNRVTVSTLTPGDDPDDNASSSTVQVEAIADLGLTKSHPDRDGGYRAGDPIDFTLVATNDGPSDAQPDVVITDTLPAGVRFTGASGPWDCVADAPTATGQEIVCTLQGAVALAPGSSAPDLVLSARLDPALDAGTVTNVARVESPTTDPDASDPDGTNVARDPVEVGTEADLSITKSHDGPGRIGDDLVFTIVVTNDGPSEARAVTVRDQLPEGLTFVDADVTDADGTCTESSGVVDCALDDPLPPESSATIALTVRVGAAAYPSVTNVVTVDSTTPDTDEGDRRAEDTVTVPPQVDLVAAKRAVGDLVVGEEGRYRVTVTNEGPTADPGPLRVTDTLPRGMSFLRAAGDGWKCTESSAATVVCERESGLAIGGTTAFTLVVAIGAEAASEAINTVTVTSPAEDLDPDSNTTSTRDPVTPVSVLTLDKSLDALRGDLATYRLTVTNAGPNDTSETVVLVDRLPQQLTFVSATGPGWSCGAVGQVVTCTHPDALSVGERSTVVLVARVDAEPGATIVNVAEVSGGGGGGGSTVTDDAELRVPAAVDLPDTGASALGQLLIALLLIGLGATIRTVARRPALA